MIKKIVLTILLGLTFCTFAFAQEGRQKPGQEQDEVSVMEDSGEEESTSVKTQYRKGKLTQWQLFDDKGRLASSIRYKNDRPILIKIFDSQGKPRHGEYKAVYSNGKPRVIERYRDGIQTTRNGYYENGQLRYAMKKKKDGMRSQFREYEENGMLKNGEYKEYFSSGRIKGMGNFRKGVPEGNFVSFCEDGRVVAEKTFKKGRLLSQSWEKTVDGRPICDDTFSYLTNGAVTVSSMNVNQS
jgi:antitoxin component YwqK of YwqJK toxin-antitoxin module